MSNNIIHIKNPLTGGAYCGHTDGLFTENAQEATCTVCLENFDGDVAKIAAGPKDPPHSER